MVEKRDRVLLEDTRDVPSGSVGKRADVTDSDVNSYINSSRLRCSWGLWARESSA